MFACCPQMGSASVPWKAGARHAGCPACAGGQMNQHKHLEVSSPGSCCWRQQPLGHSSCSPGRGTAQHREEGQGCWACPAPAPAVLCRATSIQTRSLCPGTTCTGKFRGSRLCHRGQEGSRQSFFTTFGTLGTTEGAQSQTQHLLSGLCSHELHCKRQNSKSSTSGESTWDGKKEGKIFCCTEDCIQALLLPQKQVWLDSWHSCGVLRCPHAGDCS